MNSEVLLTVAEVAKTLRVRQETIRRYINDGVLKALTLPGGDYRVRQEDAEALLRPKLEAVDGK